MVNRLSNLAEFLHNDSLPGWLKDEIDAKRDELFTALENGQEYTLTGPDGEEVKIAPSPVAA